MKKAAALAFILCLFASSLYAATPGVVPVCVTAGTANVVPVYEAAAGPGVVPVEVFASPAVAPNNCVPIRVVTKGTEQAVPIVVVSGSLGGADNLLAENSSVLTSEAGSQLQIE